MLFVTNNGQTEAILESNYEKYEEQNGAAMQISFSSFNFTENIGHALLEPNVLVEDEDGHEYIVKQFSKDRTSKSIAATHIYYELIGHRKYDEFTGTKTFNEFANWLFSGTGWTFNNVDVNETLTFNVFGNDNFLQLVQRLIIKFNCEMQILPGKVIRFKKIIGEDNDLQYRFKHNIKELSQSIDTTNVRTRIVAYGAEGLSVTYTSPLASNAKFGVIDAEPVKDEEITTEAELLEFAKASLNDVPSTNVDASVIDTDGNVGDYVWIIHEEMDLLYQTRILSKRTKRNYVDSVIEIGNTKKRTIEDVLLDQRQGIEDNKDYIEKVEEETEKSVAELVVSDNEIRATVTDVENNLRSEITITASEIRSEVSDLENNLNSTISQTASEIRLEVSDLENDLNSTISQTATEIRLEVAQTNQNVASLEIRADQIQSNVTNLENSTASSITQLSNNINLKVDKGGTITDINLTPGTATINASKINLNGAVMVNGSITGSTDITVNRNVAVGNALYFGGAQSSFDFIKAGGYMEFNSLGDFYFNGLNMYLNNSRIATVSDIPSPGVSRSYVDSQIADVYNYINALLA